MKSGNAIHVTPPTDHRQKILFKEVRAALKNIRRSREMCSGQSSPLAATARTVPKGASQPAAVKDPAMSGGAGALKQFGRGMMVNSQEQMEQGRFNEFLPAEGGPGE
jgi:hypothetical protein